MSEPAERFTTMRTKIREAFRATLRRLRGGEISPRRIALSVALGVFVGCTPLYGLHALIVGVIAFSLRLDVIVAYIAANISIPPVIPVLLFLEVQAGAWLLNGAFLPLSLESLSIKHALELSQALALGTAVIGSALAVVFGVTAWIVIHMVHRAKESGSGASQN